MTHCQLQLFQKREGEDEGGVCYYIGYIFPRSVRNAMHFSMPKRWLALFKIDCSTIAGPSLVPLRSNKHLSLILDVMLQGNLSVA